MNEISDTKKNTKEYDYPYGILYLLFFVCLIYLETVFRILVFHTIGLELLWSIFVATIVAGVLTLLCSFGGKTCNRVLASFLIIIFVLFYIIHLVYFDIFKVFLTSYSFTTGTGQVMEFWRDILTAVIENLSGILTLFIVIPVFLILLRLIFNSQGDEKATSLKNQWLYRGLLIGAICLFQFCFLFSLSTQGKALYSAYDLYYYTTASELSVKKLGLITTMKTDIGRRIFGAKERVYEEDLPENSVGVPDDDKGDLVEDEQTTPTPIPISEEVPSSQVLDIDFDKLIKEEKKESIQNMHRYFSKVVPTTENEYTGMFEGYNLILLTAEGFSPYAVEESVTPTLYRLTQEGFNFNQFYTPIWGVSTSDGEYVACNSLIPKAGVWSFYKSASNAMPFALGNQFNRLGVKSKSYHNHSYTYYKRNLSHPNMGYEFKAVGNGLNIKETWPESDLEMMEVTIPEFIKEDRFHVYYMTVSGHMNYSFTGNYIAGKNKDVVKDLPYSSEAQAYIACNVELDRALEKLITSLGEVGVLEKTVIALSADHYPYGLEKKTIDELAGHPVEENFELYKNHFILWNSEMEEQIVINKPCSSLDILPTISNIFGLEYDSRLLMGRDILSDAEAMVIFNNHSYITDKVMFNSITGKVTALTEEEVTSEYLDKMNREVNDKFIYSQKILEYDYYKKIWDIIGK